MPDDVAARLDGVLADLGSERSATAPVVDLAARRRRVARNVLVAAAAVVVVGVGISRVDLGSGGDADSGGSSAQSLEDNAGGDAPGPAATPGRVLELRSQDFDRQVEQF